MRSSVRHTLISLFDSLDTGISICAALAGGAFGACLANVDLPTTWSSHVRIGAIGALALMSALAVEAAVSSLLVPIRKRVSAARYSHPDRLHIAPAAPGSTAEGLAQLTDAVVADAAFRAACRSYGIDYGESYLRDAQRWTGYEDGTAAFYIAPGVMLHHRCGHDTYGITSRFTLAAANGDLVDIATLDQIRQYLTQHSAADRRNHTLLALEA
ncbi:hypothetical protein K7472_30240 [Streptomyces sp. PTM05]|uniref:Uncharacterized protein n=1 Tax=Streptantibioticus parmotrematis TaxID=2873249 RepID=A0ABS7R0V3_9ACTN|nr:hypothetical protein [Streptantibioticus parmotrematis]MBY8889093.1 hypothetical protein [Streptantibioticus parmotrematis]